MYNMIIMSSTLYVVLWQTQPWTDNITLSTTTQACFRGVRAAIKIEKFDQALSMLEDGLQRHPGAPELLQLREKALEGQAQVQARLEAEQQRALAARAPSRRLAEAMVARGWQVGRPQFSIGRLHMGAIGDASWMCI